MVAVGGIVGTAVSVGGGGVVVFVTVGRVVKVGWGVFVGTAVAVSSCAARTVIGVDVDIGWENGRLRSLRTAGSQHNKCNQHDTGP